MLEVNDITIWFWIWAMVTGYLGAVIAATIVHFYRHMARNKDTGR
jgi:hypothetical protein